MNQENTDNILYNINDKILKDAINKSGSKASKLVMASMTHHLMEKIF